MGLISAVNIANSGLRSIQTGLTSVANNVAQSDVEGYRRQDVVNENLSISGGVRSTVIRAADAYLENAFRIATAQAAEAEVNDYYLSRIDQMFGQPGGSGSLDTLLNEFNSSLEALATSPEDYTSRQQVLGSAQNLANSINSIGDQIQSLRQNAENEIATVVTDVNNALKRLETLNGRLAAINSGSTTYAEMLDERDAQLEILSDAMEIRVAEHENGSIAIYSKSGDTLLDVTAVQLSFDQQGNINANTLYDSNASERGVGTVVLNTTNGYQLDLINNGLLDTGRLGALINMRDNELVEAQKQLDELAAGLASAFSNVEVDGTAVTSGAASGFDVDLDGLQQGNSVSLNYVEGGVSKTVTLIRVDDPSLLPLSDNQTGAAGDQVIGIDFSSGYAAAAAAINAELSPGVVVSATASGLRFLDDGATGNSDITSVSSTQTITGLQDGTEALPLFTDGSSVYTGSLEGIEQKVGFSSRITVNADLVADNDLLVAYNSDTASGDVTRPMDLVDRFNNAQMTFSPSAGIGTTGRPYTGTVLEYASLVISDQTGKADDAAIAKATQDNVLASIEGQLAAITGVSVDEELAKLISLQNSYAANARILQAVDQMYQQLMQI